MIRCVCNIFSVCEMLSLGMDQVLAEVALGGSLNYDELVCYTENAIRPSYLLIYDA